MALLMQNNRVDILRRIVEAAVLAPSAENKQPWRFMLNGDTLTVCLDTTRALASDVGHMLSLTAVGASIENAVVAATAQGLCGNVEYVGNSVPSRSLLQHLPIARIQFVEGAQYDPLAEYIESRCTSRRMDQRQSVDDSVLTKLKESCDGFSDATVHWVDSRRLREFAKLIGDGNRMRFEYQPFHQELYENFRFTTAEVEQTRDGLDVATLQLPVGVPPLLAALRSWPRMKCANAFGFSRGVARQAAEEVRRSGAVGFLTVGAPMTQQFVEGGRALERVWLTATQLGLCFHPTASLPVFLAHARTGGNQLTPRHRELAASMSERFYRLFPSAAGRTVHMAFRIGYGLAPPVRSLRRPATAVLDLK